MLLPQCISAYTCPGFTPITACNSAATLVQLLSAQDTKRHQVPRSTKPQSRHRARRHAHSALVFGRNATPMKLAVLLAALCTASCTAITLAPERPKPQLQRANKALALRGGSLAQDVSSDPVAEILATVVARDPNQPEFIQALTQP